jgi:hypothetical protein
MRYASESLSFSLLSGNPMPVAATAAGDAMRATIIKRQNLTLSSL